MSKPEPFFKLRAAYAIDHRASDADLCSDALDLMRPAVAILNEHANELETSDFGAIFLLQQAEALLEEVSRREQEAGRHRRAGGEQFMAGVSLAVQLLQHATREEGNNTTSILAQDRGDAPQSRFVLPYLLKLLQAPALCEGFAAVLSDYLVGVVSGSLHHSTYDGLTLASMGEQGRAGA